VNRTSWPSHYTKGEKKRFTFETYVRIHTEQHAILNGLKEHGYSLINDSSFQSEGKKMMVFNKKNNEEDDRRIMKAERKQHYIIFVAPISFLDEELKADLGMKAKKEKEDKTSDAFCSLKVPIDQDDKVSKTYTVKVKINDSGGPEEFLKWRLILAEKVKNNGYTDNPDNIMNLASAILEGRSLEAF
jgi:hypothetical protein